MPGVCYLQLFLVVLTSDILRCNIPSFNVTILHLYLFRLSVLSLGSFLYLLLDFFFLIRFTCSPNMEGKTFQFNLIIEWNLILHLCCLDFKSNN